MGVPKDAVHVVIYEAPKSNWATGGRRIQKNSPNTLTIIRIEGAFKNLPECEGNNCYMG